MFNLLSGVRGTIKALNMAKGLVKGDIPELEEIIDISTDLVGVSEVKDVVEEALENKES